MSRVPAQDGGAAWVGAMSSAARKANRLGPGTRTNEGSGQLSALAAVSRLVRVSSLRVTVPSKVSTVIKRGGRRSLTWADYRD